MRQGTTKSAKNATGGARSALAGAAMLLSLSGCITGDPYWTGGPVQSVPQISSPMIPSAPPIRAEAPSIQGSRLSVPPGESAAAKVLGLTEQVATAKAENEQLAEKIRALEADIETKNAALARATTEVAEARTELANTRVDLEHWKREIDTMHERLQAADKDSLSALQATVALLRQMLTDQQPSEGAE